jgi:hypothetical protein
VKEWGARYNGGRGDRAEGRNTGSGEVRTGERGEEFGERREGRKEGMWREGRGMEWGV